MDPTTKLFLVFADCDWCVFDDLFVLAIVVHFALFLCDVVAGGGEQNIWWFVVRYHGLFIVDLYR